jgi:hypothetical protein
MVGTGFTIDGLTDTKGQSSLSRSTLPMTLPAQMHRAELESRSFNTENKVESLEDALDEMRANDVPFLSKYVVLGAVDRRQGGQGLVQFLRGKHDAGDFAVKVRGSPLVALLDVGLLRFYCECISSNITSP